MTNEELNVILNKHIEELELDASKGEIVYALKEAKQKLNAVAQTDKELMQKCFAHRRIQTFNGEFKDLCVALNDDVECSPRSCRFFKTCEELENQTKGVNK